MDGVFKENTDGMCFHCLHRTLIKLGSDYGCTSCGYSLVKSQLPNDDEDDGK